MMTVFVNAELHILHYDKRVVQLAEHLKEGVGKVGGGVGTLQGELDAVLQVGGGGVGGSGGGGFGGSGGGGGACTVTVKYTVGVSFKNHEARN